MVDSKKELIRDEADAVLGIPADPKHDSWLSEPGHSDAGNLHVYDPFHDEHSARELQKIITDYPEGWRRQLASVAIRSAIKTDPIGARTPLFAALLENGVEKALGLKPLDEHEEGEA